MIIREVMKLLEGSLECWVKKTEVRFPKHPNPMKQNLDLWICITSLLWNLRCRSFVAVVHIWYHNQRCKSRANNMQTHQQAFAFGFDATSSSPLHSLHCLEATRFDLRRLEATSYKQRPLEREGEQTRNTTALREQAV